MDINFKVIGADIIPPLHNQALQVSDWYFAKTKVLGGAISKCLVAWDFKYNKWLFTMPGHIELIEYYI